MTTPTGRRVLQHEADTRPAWLWSQDGLTLLWSNPAAAFFLGRIKKHGIKLAQPAAPIKGQVARIARLGSLGRSSLSRVQFLAGDKPASSTCACTPLEWEGGQTAVLIVGVDAIAPEFFEDEADDAPVVATVADAPEVVEPQAEAPTAVVAANDSATDTAPEPSADPIGAIIEADQHAYVEDLGQWHEDTAAGDEPHVEPTAEAVEAVEPQRDVQPEAETAAAEPIAPEEQFEAEPEAKATEAETTPEHTWAADPESVTTDAVEPTNEPVTTDENTRPEAAPSSRLTGLMDRMANHADLYSPLTDADDLMLSDVAAEMAAQAPELFRVIGRGFVADEAESTDAEADMADVQRLDADRGALPDVAESDQQDLQTLDGEGGMLPEIAAAEAPAFAEQSEALRDMDSAEQNA
ncbi:hypothetical protein, partial [Devosia sp.]|uniref:hypothetical protein n=1 Tax=Devosia sp. TaxID=1871048 RepID=UPI00326496BB